MVVGVSIFLILIANIYSRLALGERDGGHPKCRSGKKYKKNYLVVPLRQVKRYGQLCMGSQLKLKDNMMHHPQSFSLQSKSLFMFKLFGEGFQIMRYLLNMKQDPMLMNNLVKVGNVEDTAITIEADHCKKCN